MGPIVLSALKLIFRSVLLLEHKSGHLVVRGGHQQILMVLIVLSALKIPIFQIFSSLSSFLVLALNSVCQWLYFGFEELSNLAFSALFNLEIFRNFRILSLAADLGALE